jgi:hypothetical protein
MQYLPLHIPLVHGAKKTSLRPTRRADGAEPIEVVVEIRY